MITKTTYSVKAYPPNGFPIFREGIRTRANAERTVQHLLGLGYTECMIYRDTTDKLGTTQRVDISERIRV